GLSETIDIETGVLLTGRGSKAETYFNGGNDYVKAKFNPLYIEVPVNLVINIPMTTTTKLFFNAGPYAAVGVGGKSKLQTKVGPLETSSTRDIEFSNDDPFTSGQEDAAYDKLKRFDVGLNAGVGLDLKSFILKANYGFGLTKINSTESNNSNDDKNKYRTLSISVGIPLSR
ncbi:MAG: PorT family protein, partial [Sphingobacteriales bacterium]